MSVGARLRSLAAGERPTLVPGVTDAFSARLAAAVGFQAVMISGYGVSATWLGEPDVGIIALPELVELTRRIVAVTDLPIIVDVDQGLGGLMMAQRTVRELEQAGAAAVMLDDQEEERCPYLGLERSLISLEKMAERIRYAAAARSDPDFVILARCALKQTAYEREGVSLEEYGRRAPAYVAAGADWVCTGWEKTEDLAAYAAVPLGLGRPSVGLSLPFRSAIALAEFERAGYRMVFFAVDLVYAAAKAQLEALLEIRDTGRMDPARAIPHRQLLDVLGVPALVEAVKRLDAGLV